jgi:hypothetical protein
MREKLAKLDGSRRRFQGTVDRFGQKAGWNHPLVTVMLKDVSDCATHKIVTDHLWFTMHKRFASLNLVVGDVVSFDARVMEYEKGYRGRRDFDDVSPVQTDYRLSFPTKLVKVKSATQLTTPLEQKSVSQTLYLDPNKASLQDWF